MREATTDNTYTGPTEHTEPLHTLKELKNKKQNKKGWVVQNTISKDKIKKVN